jgi:hypothetical protein
MSKDDGYCCTGGDCCGPGSWCCSRAGEHTHDPEILEAEARLDEAIDRMVYRDSIGLPMVPTPMTGATMSLPPEPPDGTSVLLMLSAGERILIWRNDEEAELADGQDNERWYGDAESDPMSWEMANKYTSAMHAVAPFPFWEKPGIPEAVLAKARATYPHLDALQRPPDLP